MRAFDPGVSPAAISVPPVTGRARPVECVDGRLTSYHVAKAAGVSRKQARRAIEAFCDAHDNDEALNEKDGATLTFGKDELVDPGNMTVAEMARVVAERIGIGRFAVKKRAAERAAEREEQLRMSTIHHPWATEKHGRSIKSQQGGAVVATLACSKCPTVESIRFRQLADASVMDRKFEQKGWAVDPARCPAHNRRNHTTPKKDPTPMATEAPTFATPTPAAIAAQAKMFGLLQAHFDPDTGVYGGGYSDQKIAEECKLAIDLVVGVRRQAFGELKVPTEVAQLTADIEALEQLLNETIAPIQTELATLRNRVRECCKKFGG